MLLDYLGQLNYSYSVIRLKQRFPGLSLLLEQVQPHDFLRIAVRVAELAIQANDLNSSIAAQVVSQMKSKEPISDQAKLNLRNLSAELDAQYFEADQEGFAQVALHFFRQARAVDSLIFAVDAVRNLEFTSNAIYEAIAAAQSESAVVNEIKQILSE